MLQSFEHRGLMIKYARSGAGEPVVLLHNGGTSHAIWSEIAPALSGFELFVLDLLGYGASSKPEGGYELDTYVEILAAFVDRHRLAPVRLVGNCMGSAMSLAFAARRPEAVRALALFNPLTEATFSAGQLGSLLRLQRAAPALVGSTSRITLGSFAGSYALRFQLGDRGIERRVHERTDLCACYAAEGQSRSLLAVLADLGRYGALDRFERPPGFPPICTLWGLQNRVLSPVAGRRLNEALRPERQEWLEGCGHLPMLERPDHVGRALAEFLDLRSAQEGIRA